MIGFAGAIHAATHHGNRDGIFRGITGGLSNALGQFDERIVLDAGTTGATNNVEAGRADFVAG